jgi:two-component system sensor histidine kinase YesM
MNEVEKGNFNVNLESDGFDEIYILNESFNKMIKEIDNLTKEKVKAEIEALQYQINPHFISNTLNSIRLMAMMSKKQNIQNMTEALIRFMINVFKNKGEMTTIKDELENLENYIYMMKVRFGDKFNIHYKIKKEFEKLFILRMIIQPIIENSILHGLSEVSENGIIKINVYIKNNVLNIEVYDNGKGMNKKEISNIFDRTYTNDNKPEKCIGLINVDRRIKLFHGDKYGLIIKSIYGKYTKIIYTLPIIKEINDV